MARYDAALARQLDFDSGPALPAEARRAKPRLRLAVPSAVLRGPDKYKVLEHRRRQAQIKARKAGEAAEQLNFEC